MNNATVVRRIDELGRIVLPIDQRRALGVEPRDYVSLTLNGSNITIAKHNKTCVFCGSLDSLVDFKGQTICAACKDEISKDNNEPDIVGL